MCDRECGEYFVDFVDLRPRGGVRRRRRKAEGCRNVLNRCNTQYEVEKTKKKTEENHNRKSEKRSEHQRDDRPNHTENRVDQTNAAETSRMYVHMEHGNDGMGQVLHSQPGKTRKADMGKSTFAARWNLFWLARMAQSCKCL